MLYFYLSHASMAFCLVHMALQLWLVLSLFTTLSGERARRESGGTQVVETFSIFAVPRTNGVLGANPRASLEFASIVTRVHC